MVDPQRACEHVVRRENELPADGAMMYQPYSTRATWLLLFTLLLAAITVRPALPSDGAVTFKGITIKIDVGLARGRRWMSAFDYRRSEVGLSHSRPKQSSDRPLNIRRGFAPRVSGRTHFRAR
jgi:hypothetical protein